MRLVLGQTGAPTAVVNSSIAGFVAAAHAHEVLAVHGGPDALVAGKLEPVDAAAMPADLGRTAGSWLGGGRRAMTDADLEDVLDMLHEHRVDGISLIGGNGTMALLAALAERAQRRGMPLRTVGVPKTIDNDLDGVDHAPGFASAARYLAAVLPDLSRDHEAMRSVEPVRIVETMGRSTGWLALAATYHRDRPELAPHVVLIPETGFERTRFVRSVRSALAQHGRALVVVSEGVAPELTAQPVHAANHKALIFGGIARILAEIVTDEVGCPARGDILGVAQRCSSALASQVDLDEAEEVGRRAVRLLTEGGDTAVMVGIDRADDRDAGYRPSYAAVPLAAVAGRTRGVPHRWQTNDPGALTGFHDWLRPLLEPASPAPNALEES
jgi:6-phosphofructokinase